MNYHAQNKALSVRIQQRGIKESTIKLAQELDKFMGINYPREKESTRIKTYVKRKTY